MKDVVLDELIKEDKEKSKHKNKRPANFNKDQKGGKRLIKRGPKNSQIQEKGKFNKKKFINKDENTHKFKKFNKNNRNQQGRENRNDRNDRPRNQKRENEKKQRPAKPEKQQEPKQEKGRTLKVLGLHPDIKNQDLYKLFAAQGALQKCLIQQDNFGRNLPQAIVKYHSADAAKKAIDQINNKKVMNSILTVIPYRNKK